MAQLYTINHNYPNTYFAFHLSPPDMSMAATEHTHEISNIAGLSASLAGKAESGHVHEAVTQFRAEGRFAGPHNVELASPNMRVSVAENRVNLQYVSDKTENVMWITNSASADSAVVQFTTDSDISAGVCPFGEACLIRFKENHNA